MKLKTKINKTPNKLIERENRVVAAKRQELDGGWSEADKGDQHVQTQSNKISHGDVMYHTVCIQLVNSTVWCIWKLLRKILQVLISRKKKYLVTEYNDRW